MTISYNTSENSELFKGFLYSGKGVHNIEAWIDGLNYSNFDVSSLQGTNNKYIDHTTNHAIKANEAALIASKQNDPEKTIEYWNSVNSKGYTADAMLGSDRIPLYTNVPNNSRNNKNKNNNNNNNNNINNNNNKNNKNNKNNNKNVLESFKIGAGGVGPKNKPAIIIFHANWCGHCKKFMPEWNKFTSKNSNASIDLLDYESDQSPNMMKLHGINGFPTVKYCPNGVNDPNNSITYNGPRNAQGLNEFLNKFL